MVKRKKIKWSKFFLEFLSVFIGVSLAFALSTWNEDRREHKSASKILMEIRNGLSLDAKDMNDNINGHKQGIRANNYLLRLINGTETNTDSIGRMYLSILLRDFISIQNKTGYESLKAKGLELIKNDSLRQRIISLYDFDYEVLEKLEETYGENQFHNSYFELINDILAPHLIFDDEGMIISIKPLNKLSNEDKSKLLTYLHKIRYNRNFVNMMYHQVSAKIDTLIVELDKEIN